MTKASDVRYGRQGGRLVAPTRRAGEAAAALEAYRRTQAAGEPELELEQLTLFGPVPTHLDEGTHPL